MEYQAIVLGAGNSTRSGLLYNKVLFELNNIPIIYLSTKNFINDVSCSKIFIVCKESDVNKMKEIFKSVDKVEFVIGGKTRQESVNNALSLVDSDYVLIHDGARPFVTDDIIKRSINKANEHNAIVVGVKVKDTIKVVSDNENIVDTPNRSYLWAVQTPQVFKYDIITKAYEDAYNNNYYGTDDAMLVERIGYNVKMIEGSYNNIKITTQEDLEFGEQILKNI